MPDEAEALGLCPECGEQVTPPWVLLRYEKDDGTEGVWAECPNCQEVISPE